MPLPIRAFFQHSPALTKLGRLYGSNLQHMPRRDLMAVLHALTECTYVVMGGKESIPLGTFACSFHDHDFENSTIPQILNQLDEEIESVTQALSLIEVLAAQAQIGIEQYA